MVSRPHLLSDSIGVTFSRTKPIIHSVCSQSVVLPSKYLLPTLLVLVDCSHSSMVAAERNPGGLPLSTSESLVHRRQTSVFYTKVLVLYSASTMQTTAERMHIEVLVLSTPSLALPKQSDSTHQKTLLFCHYKVLQVLPLLPTGLQKVQSRQKAQQSRDRQIITKDLELYSTSRLLSRKSHIITAAHLMISSSIATTDLLLINQLNLLRFNLLLMRPLKVVRTTELLTW